MWECGSRIARGGIVVLAPFLVASGCAPRRVPPKAAAAPGARPKPRPAQPPVAFGTHDPFTLLAADPQRKWIALCQARKDTTGNGITSVSYMHHGGTVGDMMAPYLVSGGGPGEAIDAFLGSDPTGRWVAVVEHGKPELRDMRAGTTRDLDALEIDKTPDPSPAMGVRALHFGATGKYLLLIQKMDKAKPAASARVVLLDLASGAARSIALGAGRVWTAGLSPDESWIYASVVVRDTNGNGKLDLPVVSTTLDANPCGSAASWSSYGPEPKHDALATVFVPTSGGSARQREDVQGFVGDRLLRKRADHSLVLESPDGKVRPLVDGACDGVLEQYVPALGRGVVACHESKGKAPDPFGNAGSGYWLYAFDAHGRKPLSLQLKYPPEAGGHGTHRYGHWPTTVGQKYYDAGTQRVFDLPRGFESCGYRGDTWLLSPAVDWSSGKRAALAHESVLWTPGSKLHVVAEQDCGSFATATERYQLLGDLLFDWQKRAVAGRFPRTCQLDEKCADSIGEAPLSADGRMLLPARNVDTPAQRIERKLRGTLEALYDTRAAARGPLVWVAAGPVGKGGTGVRKAPAAPPRSPRAAPSCDAPTLPLGITDEPVPEWTTRGRLLRHVNPFAYSKGVEDDLPPGEFVARGICGKAMFARALHDLEDIASAKASSGDARTHQKLRFWAYQRLIKQCPNACALAARIVTGASAPKAGEIGYEMLARCDGKAARRLMRRKDAPAPVFLEWLLLEHGFHAKDASAVRAALGAVFEDYPKERSHAVGVVAGRGNPVLDRILTAFGKHLKGKAATDFDLGLGTAKNRALLERWKAACAPIPAPSLGEGEERCFGAHDEKLEPQTQYPEYVLPRSMDTKIAVGANPVVPKSTAPAPTTPVRVPLHDTTWEALERMLYDLQKLPGSPLGGLVFDTPFRSRGGTMLAGWRAWGDGHRYSADVATIAAQAVKIRGAAAKSGKSLALFGFVAWLNAVAEARHEAARFVVESTDGGYALVMVDGSALCSLVQSKKLRPLQLPFDLPDERYLP